MSRRIDRANRHLKGRRRDPFPKPIAVLDTNIFIETHSCIDLCSEAVRLHETLGERWIDDPSATMRIARARESTLLAMYLSKTGARTYGLHGEAIRTLRKLVPPAAGGTSTEGDFTTVFIHFVGAYLLRGWKNQVALRPEAVQGDAADKFLIGYAQKRGIPVITHEGYTADGDVDDDRRRNMRARCKVAGVQVFTSRQFYEEKINPAEEIEAFLSRFRRRAPEYLNDRAINDKMGEVLEWVYGYYRMILRGEVEGRDTPIATRLLRAR